MITKPLISNDLKKCLPDEWDYSYIIKFSFEEVAEILIVLL